MLATRIHSDARRNCTPAYLNVNSLDPPLHQGHTPSGVMWSRVGEQRDGTGRETGS